MKHGDQVKTPAGLGVFFEPCEKDLNKAYVVLKNPTDKKVYIPIVEPGKGTWECFPCDLFNLSDLALDKTLEQRQAEAEAAARAARMQQEAEMRAKMQQFAEAQRRAQEQANQA